MTPSRYCVYLNNYPFINNRGKIFPCCKNKYLEHNYNILTHTVKEMFFSPEMQAMRKKVEIGEEPMGCNVCYDIERVGNNRSFRNRQLIDLRRIIDNTYAEQPFLDNKIRGLDLRLGSTCNLTCIMCHPSDSNRWHQIYPDYARSVAERSEGHIIWTQQEYAPKNQNWAEHDQSWENIFCDIDDDLKKVYLAGGEPFYIKNFPLYIEELVNRAPQAHIEINTNATRLLPQSYIEKVKHADINLRISIDGFGLADEYTRQGTSWEEKTEVINVYSKYFNIPYFDITVNSFSLQSIPKLIEWIENNYPTSRILLRPVVNKKGLELNSIPRAMRQELIDCLMLRTKNLEDNSFYLNGKQIVDLCKEEFIDLRDQQRKQVNFWNDRGSIKLSDFNPELEEWIFGNNSG